MGMIRWGFTPVVVVVFACGAEHRAAPGRTTWAPGDASAPATASDDLVSSVAVDAGDSHDAASQASPDTDPGSNGEPAPEAGADVSAPGNNAAPATDAGASPATLPAEPSGSATSTPTSSDPPTEPTPAAPTVPTATDAGDGLVCPDHCPRLPVCVACDDGSCAEQSFVCNEDGSCSSSVMWTCPSGETPQDVPEIVPPAADPEHPCAGLACGDPCNSCPAGMICLVGPGWCDPSAACVQVVPQCTDIAPPEGVDVCTLASDCPAAQCVTCENDEQWCPAPLCRDELCGLSPNLCPESYEPCAGKEEAAPCLLCSPLDPSCDESDENKQCKSGVCQSAP